MILTLLFAAGIFAQEAPEARQLLSEVEVYDQQISTISTQVGALEATLAAAEADRLHKLTEATEAEASLASRRAGATALVRSLYRLRKFGVLRLLFGADDPIELRRRAHYLAVVLAADESRNAEFAKIARDQRSAAEAAEKANAATRSLKDQLTAQRDALEAERKKRVRLLADIRRMPSFTKQAAVETATAKAAFEASVDQREARQPPVSSGNQTEAFRQARGRLSRPVAGRLLRGFGPYVDAVTGQRTTSLGMDWAAAPGSSFRAVADGTVTRAGYVRGYGQVVMLQHGAYATLYAHANGVRVVIDQFVRAGDVLGTVGTSGLVEEGEERLHFEIRYNGTPQDPVGWLAP